MKRNLIITFVGFVLLIAVLTGCQENTGVTSNQNSKKNVFLESSVVELANSYLKFYTEYDFDKEIDVITKVEVQYTFHNIAGRDIKQLGVTLEFYDKNNVLLGLKQGTTINNLYDDYSERMPNTVIYNDANVDEVDHVKIIAMEL